MNNQQAIDHATQNLEKVKSFYSKESHVKYSNDRSYIAYALLAYRAAKNGGAKGLIAFWNRENA